jgi:hypothetical protein
MIQKYNNMMNEVILPTAEEEHLGSVEEEFAIQL